MKPSAWPGQVAGWGPTARPQGPPAARGTPRLGCGRAGGRHTKAYFRCCWTGPACDSARGPPQESDQLSALSPRHGPHLGQANAGVSPEGRVRAPLATLAWRRGRGSLATQCQARACRRSGLRKAQYWESHGRAVPSAAWMGQTMSGVTTRHCADPLGFPTSCP